MEHDFIIVGAGSAGCVLAGRLSEDPASQVLLVEAGPEDSAPEMRVPAQAATLWQGPFAWDNITVPQDDAQKRRVPWPSGRALGGSSSINGMIYVRGDRLDYDTWRDTYGCTGWGYEDLLPYFEKAKNGPLSVQDARYVHPLARAWVQAAQEHGLSDGAGPYQVTQKNGERWSTARGYLQQRDNLTVLTNTQVTKVLIENGRAVGVRWADGEARARREVVLSAGAVKSPQLLLLSGIGPADQLTALGIEPLVDLPVGEGLQDHPLVIAQFATPEVPNFFEELTPEAFERWQRERQGPFASHFAVAGGFGRTQADLPAPDAQYDVVAIAASMGPDGLVIDPAKRAVSLVVVSAHVRSRGRVALASADPFERPLIDPGYLSDEADLDTLVAGLREQRRIAARGPLAEHITEEVFPGPDVQSDEELREYVRQTVTTVWHPTSTCAMGSVCDTELRVRGVDGLRVADASVMPSVPRGNTNAPTIAVAERAADLIKQN